MKKVLSSLLLITVVTAALIVGVFKVMQNYPSDEIKNELNKGVVLILCDDIEISVDDKEKDFTYTIQKQNCEIVKTETTVNNDNIELKNNKIYPKKSGTSIITITVTTDKDRVLKKEVNVLIKDSTVTINFAIKDENDNLVKNLFIGNKYYLILNLNKQLNYEYNISTSENISNFKFIENNNLDIKFEFKVDIYNENTKFVFKYKTIEKTFNIKVYNYIDDFKLKINNNYVNEINLFLFNNNYKNEANKLNYFNNYNFIVEKTENSLNNYEIKIDNLNIANILNNNISAKAEGVCNLNIIAQDGSNFKKTFKVSVKICKIEKLDFDLSKTEFFANEEIVLKAKVDKLFALYNLEFYYNNNLITTNSISFDTKGKYTLLVKDTVSNLTKEIVVNVINDVSSSKMTVSLNDSFLNENNATFKNDILTINSSKESIDIPFSVFVSNYNNSLDFYVEFSNLALNATYEQMQNAIILNLPKKGETQVTISLKEEPKVFYTFKIIFN